MTEETDKQTNLLLDAEWRETLPAAFRPVAERHGKHRFAIAYNIGAATEALGIVASAVGRNQKLVHVCQNLAQSLNQLAAYSLELHSIDQKLLLDIQQDIVHASILQQSAPSAGSKIIVAS